MIELNRIFLHLPEESAHSGSQEEWDRNPMQLLGGVKGDGYAFGDASGDGLVETKEKRKGKEGGEKDCPWKASDFVA